MRRASIIFFLLLVVSACGNAERIDQNTGDLAKESREVNRSLDETEKILKLLAEILDKQAQGVNNKLATTDELLEKLAQSLQQLSSEVAGGMDLLEAFMAVLVAQSEVESEGPKKILDQDVHVEVSDSEFDF